MTTTVVIDKEACTITLDGKVIVPTRTEWYLVLLLCRRPGVYRSRDEILTASERPNHEEGWERSVDTTVKRLRRKGLTDIKTRYGFGYSWEGPAAIILPPDAPRVGHHGHSAIVP